VRLLTHYPSDSVVVLLVEAIEKSRDGKLKATLPNGQSIESPRSVGERKHYLAKFDRDGSYKGSVQVEESLLVNRIGMFGSGNFLVSGVDRNTNHPALALLNSDGALRRLLDVPKDMGKMGCSSSRRSRSSR
jgi:hypothetical protein